MSLNTNLKRKKSTLNLGAYAPGTRENILKHQTEYEQKFRAYIIDIICMQAKFRKKK
jgi:hypothetical protein